MMIQTLQLSQYILHNVKKGLKIYNSNIHNSINKAIIHTVPQDNPSVQIDDQKLAGTNNIKTNNNTLFCLLTT